VKRVTKKEEEEDEFSFFSFFISLPALIRPFPSPFWVAGYLLFRLDASRRHFLYTNMRQLIHV
jgi:hypothetical protein